MAQTYIDAVLAVEDKRFYRHPGIDPIAIGRALINDIRAGAYVEGGSTITQQLAKNQFFTQDKKLVRKVSEMFMAFKIESVLDKDKILELYVNSIFFGNGYYCVGDASLGYFGKSPSEMDFDECMLLAGIPNAPSNYNPVASPEPKTHSTPTVRVCFIALSSRAAPDKNALCPFSDRGRWIRGTTSGSSAPRGAGPRGVSPLRAVTGAPGLSPTRPIPAVRAAAPRGRFTRRPLPLSPAGGSLGRDMPR